MKTFIFSIVVLASNFASADVGFRAVHCLSENQSDVWNGTYYVISEEAFKPIVMRLYSGEQNGKCNLGEAISIDASQCIGGLLMDVFIEGAPTCSVQ